jgi:hypothetical protein
MQKNSTCLVVVVGCQTWPRYSLHNKAVTCWDSTTFLYQQVKCSCVPHETQPVPQHAHCKQHYTVELPEGGLLSSTSTLEIQAVGSSKTNYTVTCQKMVIFHLHTHHHETLKFPYSNLQCDNIPFQTIFLCGLTTKLSHIFSIL